MTRKKFLQVVVCPGNIFLIPRMRTQRLLRPYHVGPDAGEEGDGCSDQTILCSSFIIRGGFWFVSSAFFIFGFSFLPRAGGREEIFFSTLGGIENRCNSSARVGFESTLCCWEGEGCGYLLNLKMKVWLVMDLCRSAWDIRSSSVFFRYTTNYKLKYNKILN